jgi:hypothetical protein
MVAMQWDFHGIDPGEELPDIDTSVAHSARIYDYILGGKDNFEADRRAAEAATRANPAMATGMRENRAVMRRMTAYLAGEAGIRQFLDIGTGLPTMQNTHEVAQNVAPDSRIVYVDNERRRQHGLPPRRPAAAGEDPGRSAADGHAGPVRAGRADDVRRAPLHPGRR